MLATLWRAAGGGAEWLEKVCLAGTGSLPSVFPVSDLAVASVAAAGLAVAELVHAGGGAPPVVTADRRLASLWFGSAIRPQGWEIQSWDAVAGDYQAADGWVRLHTNAPHHRAAALAVLDAPAERDRVARAVRDWKADALEAAVVGHGGCAAAMRDEAAWLAHPQGVAVAAEPLLHHRPEGEGPEGGRPGEGGWSGEGAGTGRGGPAGRRTVPPGRPLAGVRVLDMTRVLAGPVATRFLAGFGADVLRIDPPWWNEPAVVPDVARGKRCARLDLRVARDREVWEGLLRQADVLVHGYRPGALDGLGLGEDRRQALRPGLVDVSLDAYGFTGPWAGRRGFDSLVQMSSGIAEAGMRRLGRDRPTPLPVQALDHATGYLLALAVLRGLTGRLNTGRGCVVRTSLARTAALLTGLPRHGALLLAPETPADWEDRVEATPWGPARRLVPPCRLDGAAMRWDLPAADLGTSGATWTA